MNNVNKKTIYQFTTTSRQAAGAAEVLLNSPKSQLLVIYFDKIKSSKQQNTFLRLVRYLVQTYR